MCIYGYCRISTPKQSIERQVRNISSQFPEAIIIREAYTGTTFDRPLWNKLQKLVKAGDTIVFDSVSRMSRDAQEGYEIYEQLFSKKVNLCFLKEPHINTATYQKALAEGVPMTGTSVDVILDGINKYLLLLAQEQIKIAFEQSQKEVDDLRQRTREGIETARLEGKRIGTPKGTHFTTKKSVKAKEIILKRSKDFGGYNSDVEVMKLTGLARNTYYKYKKELRSAS